MRHLCLPRRLRPLLALEKKRMRTMLLVLAALAFLAGAGILAGAQSAIHEIEGFMLFLICAVLISGAATVGAINRWAETRSK